MQQVQLNWLPEEAEEPEPLGQDEALAEEDEEGEDAGLDDGTEEAVA
jgi:hypothetical protein